MSTTMRAKMYVGDVEKHETCEQLTLHAVAASGYPADGVDEDNSYARWSPNAKLTITIMNPALFGKFNVGDKYYVDFTPAP